MFPPKYFQGFTWTAKISTGRDGVFISARARDWQNIGVEIIGGTGRDGIFFEAGRGGRFFFPEAGRGVFFFF